MADLWTEDPRLASLYDVECAGREDHDFYIDLATELQAMSVVDLGCGTGVFAVDLAQRGHVVTGVDPAEPMLEIARARPSGDQVTWVNGQAADLATSSADLIVMMGHVAQYFIDDDQWADTLRELRRAIRPDGHLTFEVRNPALDWVAQWTRANTTAVYDHPDGGTFTAWVQSLGRSGPPDSYCETHEGHSVLPDGQHLWAAETLRFRSFDEVYDSLTLAGFHIEQTWGNWDRSERTDTSPEFIVLAS